jgi:hypothetical protein
MRFSTSTWSPPCREPRCATGTTSVSDPPRPTPCRASSSWRRSRCCSTARPTCAARCRSWTRPLGTLGAGASRSQHSLRRLRAGQVARRRLTHDPHVLSSMQVRAPRWFRCRDRRHDGRGRAACLHAWPALGPQGSGVPPRPALGRPVAVPASSPPRGLTRRASPPRCAP